jgi:hypothetical protein
MDIDGDSYHHQPAGQQRKHEEGSPKLRARRMHVSPTQAATQLARTIALLANCAPHTAKLFQSGATGMSHPIRRNPSRHHDRRQIIATVLTALGTISVPALATAKNRRRAREQAKFVNFTDVAWQKFSPDQPDSDLARIAILHVSKETGATQLLIRTPPNYYIPKHWHSANETHTVIKGVFVFEHTDSTGLAHRVAQNAGSFNYLPARMVHRAWTKHDSEGLLFITVDAAWDVNFVPDSQTSPPTE